MRIKILKGILALIAVLIGFLSWSQVEIHYQNNVLHRVLQKSGVPDFSNIQEISIKESVRQIDKLQGKFFEIQSGESPYKYIYVGRVNSCRAGGCSISFIIPKEGESEYFDYFILFDENKTVQLVRVFNYQATHGHEITAKGWLKQFIGHDGAKPLQVDKNIDAISGATISVNAITFDIEMITLILKSL